MALARPVGGRLQSEEVTVRPLERPSHLGRMENAEWRILVPDGVIFDRVVSSGNQRDGPS